MLEIIFAMLWYCCPIDPYPMTTTDKILTGIAYSQVVNNKTMIVAIVVSVVVAFLTIMVLVVIVYIFVSRKRKYERLENVEPPPGLQNTSETCYMNSMMQALASSELLIERYSIMVLDDDDKFRKLSKFIMFLKCMNDSSRSSSENTKLLKEIIIDVGWERKSQQDTFQCLSAFINGVQKDFTDVLKEKKEIMPPKFQLLHQFTENSRFNKIQDHLALPVPLCGNYRKAPGVKIEDLIDEFFRPSVIDDGPHETQMSFYKTVPNILIIHIQANETENDITVKPTYYIQYEEKMKYKCVVHTELDATKGTKTVVNYQLRAIVHHMGSVECGHYVAYRMYEGHWFLANDEQVEQVSFPDKKTPYIMLYEKISEKTRKDNKKPVSRRHLNFDCVCVIS